MTLADNEDIKAYNNLLWNIENFNAVRFYRIDFNFASYFTNELRNALTDDHFVTFINYPDDTAQNYLFHFKSVEDVPSSFALKATSNIFIVNAVWGNTTVDQYGNPHVPAKPSIFCLND